jgi:hypothetical protein
MPESGAMRQIAMLWHLGWNDDRLRCAVYRTDAGMQLRVESAEAVVITERFDFQPRALARAQALRAALMRRGWRDAAPPAAERY